MSSTRVERDAVELHQQAIVVDGHSDILIPVADGKMRLADRVEVPDPVLWEPPPGFVGGAGTEFGFPPHAIHFGPMGQYDIPRLLEGGVTVETFAIYLEDQQREWAVKRGLEMAWSFHREVDESDDLELVTSVDDIHRIKRDGKCGAVLSLEGFEALGTDLRLLDIYYKLGLRMASLTHCRRNVFADGPQDGVRTGGLTALGKEAVRRMNELGVVVDLAHINQIGFWEILETTTDPVVVSHSSSTMFPDEDATGCGPLGPVRRPRLMLPHDRPRLEALASNGGVLGVIWFYQETADEVLADIETALAVMGPDHVGIGTDLYGLELAPAGLEDISKMPVLTRHLVERGHSDEVIKKILGENYLRVFKEVWTD